MKPRYVTFAALAVTFLLGAGLSGTFAAEPRGEQRPDAPAAAHSTVPTVLVPGATSGEQTGTSKRCTRGWTTPCYRTWCPLPATVWRYKRGEINADGDCVPGRWVAKKGKRRHCGC